MNKRRELTDMKREWETSGRGGRAGERNNSSVLVIRDKAKKGEEGSGSRGAFNWG